MKKSEIKIFLKNFLPPYIYHLMIDLFFKKYGWFGDYKHWNLATQFSEGYDSNIIFEKVCEASKKIEHGDAIFERDSLLFFKQDNNWPLLSNLLWISSQQNGKLSIIDYGGSLGSTFFQHKEYLNKIDIKWNIIEQENFVNYGRLNIIDKKIHFYLNFEECYVKSKSNTLLLSSVLPYIENPFDFIKSILKYNFNYILVDRTYFTNSSQNRITIQKISPTIYDASYPCWIFSQKDFEKEFLKRYTIKSEYISVGKKIKIYKPTSYFYSKGFFFVKKEDQK